MEVITKLKFLLLVGLISTAESREMKDTNECIEVKINTKSTESKGMILMGKPTVSTQSDCPAGENFKCTTSNSSCVFTCHFSISQHCDNTTIMEDKLVTKSATDNFPEHSTPMTMVETPTCYLPSTKPNDLSPSTTITETEPMCSSPADTTNNPSSASTAVCEALLGTFTSLLLVALVIVSIGWTSTCIVMRRRCRQYNLTSRNTDVNISQSYTQGQSTPELYPNTAYGQAESNYNTLGPAYETLGPQTNYRYTSPNSAPPQISHREKSDNNETYSKLAVNQDTYPPFSEAAGDTYSKLAVNQDTHPPSSEAAGDTYSKLAFNEGAATEEDNTNNGNHGEANDKGRHDYFELEPGGLISINQNSDIIGSGKIDSYSNQQENARRHDYFELEPKGLKSTDPGIRRLRWMGEKGEEQREGCDQEGCGQEREISPQDYEVPLSVDLKAHNSEDK